VSVLVDSPAQAVSGTDSVGAGTRPLTIQLQELASRWASSQQRLVTVAAEFADSAEWIIAGSPTAAHWLAGCADIETCTAREWIRIGRVLRALPAIAAAYANGTISYSKVRTLTRIATVDNEAELLAIAVQVPASELGRALAVWFNHNSTPEQLDAHQHNQRSIKWRTEADAMTVFTLRLPPMLAGILITMLTAAVMRSRPRPAKAETWPTVVQQHADALEHILTEGAGTLVTEIVLHVRGDGCTLDDGTPITDTVIEQLAPTSFLRAMIHDAQGHPVDVSNRRRHPTTRQKRLVKERDHTCTDCGRTDLLQYDHTPAHNQTGHTLTTELKLRCAPCHHKRHTNRQ